MKNFKNSTFLCELISTSFNYFLALGTAGVSWDMVLSKNCNSLSVYLETTMYAYSIDHTIRYILKKLKKLQNEVFQLQHQLFWDLQEISEKSRVYASKSDKKSLLYAKRGKRDPFPPILEKKKPSFPRSLQNWDVVKLF